MTTQLDWTVGIGKETTYGVAVPATRYFETPAAMDFAVETVQGTGSRPGTRMNRESRNSISRVSGSGDFDLEISNKGFGMLLEAAIGPVTVGAAVGGRRMQTAALRGTDPVPSYTIEQVLPYLGGTGTDVQKYTGCVAESIAFDFAEGGFVTSKVSWLARDLVHGGTASAASYPSSDALLNFTGSSIMVAGLPQANVSKASVSIKNNLDTNGFNLGGGGKRSRINALGRAEVTGSLTIEHTNSEWLARALARTTFTLALAASTAPSDAEVLGIYLPFVKVKGGVPKSNGGSPSELTVEFEAFNDVNVSYNSTDTAP